MRICAEIREELEPQEQVAGSSHMRVQATELEVGTAARRGQYGRRGVRELHRPGWRPHFGGPSAELQLVRRALGDVPLGRFFCGR
jgi:hypothetical protein